VVVDDGETVPEELISPFAREINIVLCPQRQSGPATARNAGAKLSKSNYLAFLDDDCLPERDWLKNFAENFKADPELLLGGKIINALPDNIYSTASQLLVDFLYEYFEQRDSQNHFFTSNNIAISRVGFQKLNGFDQSFPLPAAEDRDLCRRWRRMDGSLRFVPAARINHAHNLNFRGFLRQHFNYGRGAFQFHKLRLIDENQNIAPEPLGFYKKLLFYPFRATKKRFRTTLFVLFLFTQMATVSGFFYQKLKERRLKKDLTVLLRD
jgi:GT2 family glycosyltransferase